MLDCMFRRIVSAADSYSCRLRFVSRMHQKWDGLFVGPKDYRSTADNSSGDIIGSRRLSKDKCIEKRLFAESFECVARTLDQRNRDPVYTVPDEARGGLALRKGPGISLRDPLFTEVNRASSF